MNNMKLFHLHILLLILVILGSQFANAQADNGIDYLIDTTSDYSNLELRKMDIEYSLDEDVFIAYYGAGLGVYSNNELIIYNMQNSEIPSNRVNHIYIDFSDAVISTDNGITIYNNGNWETPGDGLTGFHIESSIKTESTIYALCSKDNFIDTLAVYDGNNWSFIQFPGYQKSFLQNSPICLHNKVLYFGTNLEGLFSYDGEEIKHLLYDVSIYDIIAYNNQIWISLNNNNTYGESILIFNPQTNAFSKFSNHPAYESTHNTIGAAFSLSDNGKLNIVYAFHNQLIINRIYNNSHDIDIYSNQQLSISKFNASQEINGKFFFSTWYYSYCFIIEEAKHQSFLSGFWSKNIKTLSINKVGATVKSFGSMFWDGNSLPRYEVPIDSGTNSIFASGIWVGGYDPEDNLHLSAVTFNESNDSDAPLYDFSPGILSNNEGNAGVGDTSISNKYDRIWKIDRLDIEQFNYELNLKSFIIPEDFNEWPGNSSGSGNTLAPFVDNNNDGIYDINDGDYPQILGDQMLWWTINDNTHPNQETGGEPLGIELHNSFFGFKFDNPSSPAEDLINYQTYLKVKIVNRSMVTYDSVFIGIWVDSDIGYPFDDYVGCDVQRNSFYFYNADPYDETFLDYIGYGNNPPVQTVTILNGPDEDPDGIDNDSDGIVDNERMKMSRFIYYNNSSQGSNPATTDPTEAQDYYNYMTGYWKDGTPLCYGGNGHHYGGGDINTPCKYMFPGNTDPDGAGTNGIPQEAWDEVTEENTPNDRRGLCSIGPFTMEAGEINEIDILFAYIPNDGTKSGNFNYQPSLDSLITWYNENRIPSNYEDVNQLSISDNDIPVFSIHPNPAKDKFQIQSECIIDTIEVFDINGKKVKSISVNNYSSEIPVSNWNEGIYILRISSDNKTYTEKLIIL